MTEAEILYSITSFLNALTDANALWVDFDVVQINPWSAQLSANTQLSQDPNFLVHFGPIFFVSLPMNWTSDLSFPVCELVTGEEAHQLNLLYEVTEGFHWFRFRDEHLLLHAPLLICSESFKWSVAGSPGICDSDDVS